MNYFYTIGQIVITLSVVVTLSVIIALSDVTTVNTEIALVIFQLRTPIVRPSTTNASYILPSQIMTFFYCTTVCISAVFAVGRYPSVRLSDLSVSCVDA